MDCNIKIEVKNYEDLKNELEKLNCKEVFYYDGIFEKENAKEIEIYIYQHNGICFVIPAEKSSDIYPLLIKHNCASSEEREMYIAQLKKLLDERKEEINELKEKLKNKRDEEKKLWEIIKSLNFWSVVIPMFIGGIIGYFINSSFNNLAKNINVSNINNISQQISKEKEILTQINEKLEKIEKNNKNYFYELRNTILKIKNTKQKCNESDCKAVNIINNCK